MGGGRVAVGGEVGGLEGDGKVGGGKVEEGGWEEVGGGEGRWEELGGEVGVMVGGGRVEVAGGKSKDRRKSLEIESIDRCRSNRFGHALILHNFPHSVARCRQEARSCWAQGTRTPGKGRNLRT